MSEQACNVPKPKIGWGSNTIKGGGKDEVPGATLSGVHQSPVLSATGRGQGTALSNQPALVNKLQNQSNEKIPRDRDVTSGDGKKSAEKHFKVANQHDKNVKRKGSKGGKSKFYPFCLFYKK